MPPRRARSKAVKNSVDTKKTPSSQETNQSNEELGELKKLYDGINPDDIFKCKHPLEMRDNHDSSNNSKQILLTPIQKAITYCIQHSGDSATDDEILAFIHRFWTEIVTYGLTHNIGSKYNVNSPMNKRVLRINLAIPKDGKSLFIKFDENKWKLNSTLASKTSIHNSFHTTVASSRNTQRNAPVTRGMSASGSNSNISGLRASMAFPNSNENSTLFQDKILEILKNAKDQSLTLQEIIKLAAPYDGLDGIYPSCPLHQRVRLVLTIKKVVKEVEYNEITEKWSIASKQSDRERQLSLPKELKGMKIKDMSIGELWTILKEKQIY